MATLTSLALFAAGCTTSADKTSAARARSAAVHNQINPVAYADLKSGGTLNYPLTAPITNFNTYELTGDNINGNTASLMNTMMPSLFNIDSANKFTFNPNYLTGEPKVATAPAQSMTYEINPKAKWSDGTPISYRDFVAQWQALNASNPNFSIKFLSGYGEIASVVRGATDQEVVVTLRTGVVDPDWRSMFSPLYPLSLNSTPAAFNTSWQAKPLLSGGPFMFGGADPAAKTYTVVRNPGWWGRAPKLASIVFRVQVSPTATTAALQNHQIDLQNIGQDAATLNSVKAVSGISVRRAGSPTVRDITINGSRPQLADVRVRQALAMGIDRDAIAKTELQPLGITTTAPDDHIFLADQSGYQDNAGAIGKYDPTAAGKLLDTAGWVDDPAKHVRMKAGKPLEISFVIPAAVPLSLSEAQLVASQLAQIDVKVDIKQVNGAQLLSSYVEPGNYDFTVFSWIGGNFPISGASTIYEPEQPGSDWQQNYSRVSVPQIDTLFKQAESSLDQAAANAAANQADALIWQNVLSLPLYQRPDIWAVNSNVANFGAFGFASIDWTAVGFRA